MTSSKNHDKRAISVRTTEGLLYKAESQSKLKIIYSINEMVHLTICFHLSLVNTSLFVMDKSSSLSCQKVAYSITSSKMGNNVAKQTSVLLRNTSEYIRRYPSSYCTLQFLINKSNRLIVRRGVVGKASDNLPIQETYYAWAYHKISVLFLRFFIFSLFFQLLRVRDSYFLLLTVNSMHILSR